MNGVLRNIARNLDNLSMPDRKDTIEWLSVTYSMPEWIVKQWLSSYEEDTVEKMLQDFLKEKPTSVRCNLNRISPEELIQKLEREGVRAERQTLLPYALWISGYDYLEALPSFRQGDFQVQDVSSMLVAEWAGPQEGDYIIDVCAAPGGKALHLADKLAGSGCVEARDLTVIR